MKIAVCVKLAPDASDIETKADGSITLERAEWTIGGFDLQAIEAAVRLAEATGGTATAISAGPPNVDNSKLKKDILSRGPDELRLIVDERLAGADTGMTATLLAAAIQQFGPFEVALFGEGSADLYFQQTGLQVGERLGWPVLNFVSKISPQDGALRVERTLEDAVEVLDVPLPAALSVTSDINPPRLPNIKQILMAGKKPASIHALSELGLDGLPPKTLEVLDTHAPRQAQRKQVMITGSAEEAAQALLGYLAKEGLL